MTFKPQTNRYDEIRKLEHSTLGDSLKRHRRDPDAFTAGAQWAFDNLLSRTEELLAIISPSAQKVVVGASADLLGRLHHGGPI